MIPVRQSNRPKDMRKWTPEQRKNIDQGPVADIVDVDGNVVTKMRLSVFEALSTKPDLVADDQIHLVDEVNGPAIRWFVTYINKLTGEKIESLNDAFRNLHICHAAEALGMRMYTQQIFDKYYKLSKNHSLPYEDLIGIAKVDNSLGHRLFKDVAYDLATMAWNEEVPNTAAFDQELAANNRLAHSVNKLRGIWETAARREAEREERLRVKTEAARLAKEREARQTAVEKERQAKDKKKWDEQKQKDIELRARVNEKKRKGEKMTLEEANMHYVMYGKRVPI